MNGIRQSETTGGVTRDYLVDTNRAYAQVIEESDTLSGLTRMYLHGDDLISQGRVSGGVASTAVIDTYYYDGLGSVRGLTDTTGSVSDGYTYQVFGNLEAQNGTTDNRYLFTGEQFDPNVGFYYLRARYYNPSIGRFQTMDTYAGRMHEPQTLHKYLYAHADPVNMVDPSGNFALAQINISLSVGAIRNVAAVASVGVIIGLGPGAINPPRDAKGNRRFGLWDAIAVQNIRGLEGLQDKVLKDNPALADAIANPQRRSPPGHHTIPIYLCGGRDQEPSVLSETDHKLVHASIAAVSVAKEAAESIADRTLGTKRKAFTLDLAETREGRAAIATALQFAYQSGGWLGKGVPPIGEVFSRERVTYISGENTSLQFGCVRRR